MNDKDTNKIIQELFLVDTAPPLTNCMVDSFLLTGVEHPTDKVQMMRRRFVSQIMENIPKTKLLRERKSFGDWIETTRKKLQLTQWDIADQLEKKDSSYINDIESGSIPPWRLDLRDSFHLIILFKIHFTVLAELFRTSFVIEQGRNQLNIAARTESQGGKSKRFSEVQKGLEFYLANRAEKIELDSEVEKYISNLKANLEQKGMTDFLE
jgi:transcriptional regulator with XRE-family HTH domain